MNKTPIHIITGFLGAGKTTFIKRILGHNNSHRTLVLINEIGKVGIDDLLIRQITDNTHLLSSGCMCCAVLSDVKQSLLDVLGELRRGVLDFDHIIIETTGLANPASILNTLQNDSHLKGVCTLHGMTCVVDGELAFAQMHAPEWLVQIVASHQLVLSKQDRINDQQKQAVIDYIASITDSTWVLADEFVDMSVLFAKTFTNFDHKFAQKQFFTPSIQNKHNSVQTCVLSFDKPVDWAVFGLWLSLLLNRYGTQILRIKGMLYLKDEEKPIILHGVGHCLYPPEHLDTPLWDNARSQLVMITRGVDVVQIERSARVFLSVIS